MAAKKATGVDEAIKRAALEKSQLELQELASKIRNIETPRERMVKLLTATIVPLVTAVTALGAAYYSFVAIPHERDRLRQDQEAFVRLKEGDFVKSKYQAALELLAKPGTDKTVALGALRDLAFGKVPPNLDYVDAVSVFVGNENEKISATAAEVLKDSGYPARVATTMSNRLASLNGPRRLDLVRLIGQLPAQKIESELDRLLASPDAATAGGAALAIAEAGEFSWSEINLSDPRKRNRFTEIRDLILMQKNPEMRIAALTPLWEKLFSREAVSPDSDAGDAACLLIRTSAQFPDKGAIRRRMLGVANMSPINRIIVHALLGEQQDKDEIVRLYKSIVPGFPGLDERDEYAFDLTRAVLDLIGRQHQLPQLLAPVSFEESNEIIRHGLVRHLNWASVPDERLRSWAAITDGIFAGAARRELFNRMGDNAIAYFETDLGLNPRQLIHYWARSPAYFDKLKEEVTQAVERPPSRMTDTPTERRPRPSAREIFIAIELMANADHVLDLLRTLQDIGPNFYLYLSQMKNHRDLAFTVLSESKRDGLIDVVSAALLALNIEQTERAQQWILEAATHQVAAVDGFRTMDWAAHFTEQRAIQRTVPSAMVLSDAVSDQAARASLEKKLRKALSNLLAIPVSGSWTELVVDEERVRLGSNRLMRGLYKRHLPDFLRNAESNSCLDLNRSPNADSIAFKALIAKYALAGRAE